MTRSIRVRFEDPELDWTAPGVFEIVPGLYRIPLPLPEDGLRAVNVYAYCDGDHIVLVDGGWALPLARERLRAALRALGFDLDQVRRVLVTHVHRDHYTLAVALRRDYPQLRVGLGRGERYSLSVAQDPTAPPWQDMLAQLRKGGAEREHRELRAAAPPAHDPEDWADPDEWIDAPTQVALTTATWQVLHTPGHTRGHVVFVDDERGVLFAGDHVLPHITPSIGFEVGPMGSPLADYLGSLRLVRSLPDRMLLPAHGPPGPSVHARVDELLRHHDNRLRRTADAVRAGATTAYEVAHRLRWTRRERPFSDLDLLNRCLAVTETMAHLDVLVASGELTVHEHDHVRHYTPS